VTLFDALVIVAAGTGAGTINAVVGSGSLITFPALVALGYAPVVANVSNNIGLVPGSLSAVFGYRRELRGQTGRVARLAPASALGALTGSSLLLVLPSTVFRRVVIVLILVALALVITQPVLSRRLSAQRSARAAHRAAAGDHRIRRPVSIGLTALVAAAGIYGGYFGAAQGIILISLLGIFLDDDLQRLNATKNVLALTVNLVASVVFVATTTVDWAVVALIAVGSTIGGQIGASVGRRLDPRVYRAVIVVVGASALIRLL